MNRRLVVLYNLPGSDKEASDVGVMEEADDVMAAAVSLGFEASLVGVDGAGLSHVLQGLARDKASSVVFNLCEGLDGVARHEFVVAGYMDLLGLTYTGNGALTLSWCLDKWVSKAILRAAGVPAPKGLVCSQVPRRSQPFPLTFPVIAKPLREDGSLGMSQRSVVNSITRLREQVAWLLETFKQPVLVESYLSGREFNVGVLGDARMPQALPPAEIRFEGFADNEARILTHAAKWDVGSRDDLATVPVCPADIDPELSGQLQSLAQSAYSALGCRDYARVDFRLDSLGNPQVIEVNPNPDIAKSAGLARAIRATGRTYEDLVAEITERAWKRHESASH